MSKSFLKFLAGCLTGLFLLSACMGDTTTSGPTPRKESVTKPPFRTASIGPGGATRNVPTLEDLFGRFQEEEVRIALLLPLTGPGANAGSAFLDAASMALFESYDPRLQLFPLDTHGTPEGARAAALEAVRRERRSIRELRGIEPPRTRCRKCGAVSRTDITGVSIRSALFALKQTAVVSEVEFKALDRSWRKHRVRSRLDAYGRRTEPSRDAHCGHG